VHKSELEIGPIHHSPRRDLLHGAVLLCRVMRQRLKTSGASLSPDGRLNLRRI
jgi:hypothetical protein